MARKKGHSKTSGDRMAENASRHVSSKLHDGEIPTYINPKWSDGKNVSSPKDLITLLDKGNPSGEANKLCFSGCDFNDYHRNTECDAISEKESETCNGELRNENEKDPSKGNYHDIEMNSNTSGIHPVCFYGGQSYKPQHFSSKTKIRNNAAKNWKQFESCTAITRKEGRNSCSSKRKVKPRKRASKLRRIPFQPRKKTKIVCDNGCSEELDNSEFVVSLSSAETDENGNEPSKQNGINPIDSHSAVNIDTVVDEYWVNSGAVMASHQTIHPKNFYGCSKNYSSPVVGKRLLLNNQSSLESQSTCSEESFASGPVPSNSSCLAIKRKGSEYYFFDPFETSPESSPSHSDVESAKSNDLCNGVRPKETKKCQESESLDKYLVNQGTFVSSESNSSSLTSPVITLSDSDSNFTLLSEENNSESHPSSTQSSPSSQASITKYFKSASGSLKKGKLTETTPSRNRFAKGSKRSGKKLEQMYLDFGQKDFGHVTCSTCGMVYTKGQPDDEGQHLKFHKSFVSGLRFPGWKNERVLQKFVDGRIIMVTPSDHHLHVKKVEEIRNIVDIELGFVTESPFRQQEAKTFLFVSVNKRIVGCAVAVQIQEGYPVMPNSYSDSSPDRQLAAWSCSTTPVPAQCGISRIWVFNQFRRKKIATRLVNCIRNHFMYGCNIPKEMLAFSDPTPDGKAFAQAYSGTAEFLVFR